MRLGTGGARLGWCGALDDDAPGWLNPAAVLGEAGVRANGANDRIARNRSTFCLFDDGIEGGAEILSPAGGQSGRVGVTVKVAAMGNCELVNDFLGAAPEEEVGVDGIAVFVVANAAFALVAARIGGLLGGAGPSSHYSVEIHVRSLGPFRISPDRC
jgi:hypothetical protein